MRGKERLCQVGQVVGRRVIKLIGTCHQVQLVVVIRSADDAVRECESPGQRPVIEQSASFAKGIHQEPLLGPAPGDERAGAVRQQWPERCWRGLNGVSVAQEGHFGAGSVQLGHLACHNG